MNDKEWNHKGKRRQVAPAIMTTAFLVDKYNINKAVEHVFEAPFDEKKGISVNRTSLKRTLKHMETKNQFDDWIIDESTRFISNYYDSLVLNETTLMAEDVALIKQVFLGEKTKKENESQSIRDEWTDLEQVQIIDATVETTFDAENGYYTSWVHLGIENKGDDFSQYLTNFTLPEGCYISDYYLNVAGENKRGLIADKRAANWIYQKIVRFRRDPGILTYLLDGRINFRIFPFSKDEIRHTGIAFVHVDAVELQIDHVKLELKTDTELTETLLISDDVFYIPAQAK